MLESLEKIKQKYYDIIPRSFSTKLELFLFSKCFNDRRIGDFTFSDLWWFEITDELIRIYINAWALGDNERIKEDGLTMKEIDEIIRFWSKNNSTPKAEFFEKYRLNFITDFFPFSDFEKYMTQIQKNEFVILW